MDFPEHWTIRPLGELASSIQYGYTVKAQEDKIGPKLLRITDIQNGSVNWEAVPFCQVEDSEKRKYLLSEGDLVFARTGATVGKSYLIKGVIPEAVFASYLIRVRLHDRVDPKYVSYFFQSPQYWRQISESSAGIGQPNVNGKKLAQLLVPVAPCEQQKRIVAEIEKQFSRLDEAVVNLKRVKANLKRYKAAVLKAAVEGKLTEQWRQAHPDVEPASELLKRILAERRAKWSGSGKYREPVPPDMSHLPELPHAWTWASIGQLTELVTKGSSPQWQGFDYCDEGIVFVRSQNVSWGSLDLQQLVKLPATFNDKERKSVLKAGDVLLNIVGASIGRAAIASPEVQGGNVNQAVAVIRLLPAVALNRYVMFYLISTDAQRRIHSEKVDVARANFSLADAKLLPIPLPPIAEQAYIADHVEQGLSMVEAFSIVLSFNNNRQSRLRQALLRAAFSGRLGLA